MGNYTLLADDNCRYSRQSKLYEAFRAHIVFNIIANGTITLSDNQLMSSPNLRLLIRQDSVIRELVKERRIVLAVREHGDTGIMPLADVFEAFRLEGKLPKGFKRIGDSPEIAFLEQHGEKRPWNFASVRSNFTDTSKSIIFAQLRNEQLTEADIASVQELIAAEQERDGGGLGREFLQRRLPAAMGQYGILTQPKAKRLLTTCTDAVYLSNLPKTIGLNPIYAEEHQASFRLMRGHDFKFEPFGDDVDLKARLNAEHFTHGLNQLDLDDINAIQRTDAFRSFGRLSQSDNPVGDFDQMFLAYGELNRVIEDRIVDRFRPLMRNSPIPEPRWMRRQCGVAVSQGSTIVMDVLSIASFLKFTPEFFIPGLIANWVVDAVRKRIDPPRPHLDAARRDLELKRLGDYLADQDKTGKLRFGEQLVRTQSFDKEIIVR